MALTLKEQSLVSSLSNLGFDMASQLHAVAYKAICKAYSSLDGGEFARAVFHAVPLYAQESLARWFKRHGLNVSVDGPKGSKSIIGGVLKTANERRDVTAAKQDCIILPVVAGNLPAQKDKTTVDADRPLSEVVKEAEKALTSFVASQKKKDARVGAVVNDRITAGKNPLAELNLTIEEIAAVKEFVTSQRRALPPLKLAA